MSGSGMIPTADPSGEVVVGVSTQSVTPPAGCRAVVGYVYAGYQPSGGSGTFTVTAGGTTIFTLSVTDEVAVWPWFRWWLPTVNLIQGAIDQALDFSLSPSGAFMVSVLYLTE